MLGSRLVTASLGCMIGGFARILRRREVAAPRKNADRQRGGCQNGCRFPHFASPAFISMPAVAATGRFEFFT